MATKPLTRAQCEEAVRAVDDAIAAGYYKGGKPSAIQVAFKEWSAQHGSNVNTFQSRLRAARIEYGLEPNYPFQTIKRAVTDGVVTSETQAPAREPFEEPENRPLKRQSVLVDAEGGVIQQWRVYGPEGSVTPERLGEIVRQALENLDRAAPITPAPEHADSDLLNLLPATDGHIGMMAWGRETGEDYDLATAREAHISATADLISRLPSAELAVVLNIGDHLHQNDNKNATPQSGHTLDVDGRFAKVLMTAIQIEIDRVEMAKETHTHVIYRILSGNHDPEAAFAVAAALVHHYRNDPRVTVDASPSMWWFYLWGKVLLGATHGDKIKPASMKGYMSDACSKWWGESEWRHVFYGHWHRQSMLADGSTLVECLGTMAARDAWSAPQFTGGRLMQAMTFHRDRGLVSRLIHNHTSEAA